MVLLMTHRILLAVSGLSPQIVTETVYALAVAQPTPWIPDEVHLVTTMRGAENARLRLLSAEPGWFARLLADWNLPPIAFGTERIHVVQRADGSQLDDIRDESDNLAMADAIVSIVRELTSDDDTQVHASIAGGRKTMGFYLGHAMSLYARPQDRLSHVLISAPFESHPEFFYPSPVTRVIQSLGRGRDALDASDAQVLLGEIPFLRLRDALDPRMFAGEGSYAQTIAAAQSALDGPTLAIDLGSRRVQCGARRIEVRPAELAFLAWFANRTVSGLEGLLSPKVPDVDYAKQYLDWYERIVPRIDDVGATADRLRRGMDKSFFEERKSKLKKVLRDALGLGAATPYLIHGEGRPMRYRLSLPASVVRFTRLDACRSTAEAVTDEPIAGKLAAGRERRIFRSH